jgi:hypothetical protein
MNSSSDSSVDHLVHFTDDLMCKHTENHLTDHEEFFVRGALQGLNYEIMAKKYFPELPVTDGYVIWIYNKFCNEIAPKLWKNLSEILNESVNIKNFRNLLESFHKSHQDRIFILPPENE